MIKIHPRRPLARVDQDYVKLSRAEYTLISALGMMDNKLVPHQLLLDIMFEDQVQIPADKDRLLQRMSRLRRKIGRDRLKCLRRQGYMLVGDVQFTDEL
jgi:DNA-binding winged helix-turn-helix (wHTH) protein